jgi:hypothetical protein
MAISIDWATKVIFVPKNYLTNTGGGVYELDVNQFRLDLKDLEDSEVGMSYPTTHNHNTAVTLGGVTYARIVEMINGYTVTFENGSYAVRLVNANTNIEDVTNVNNVSVRSSNSAGLIEVNTAGTGVDFSDLMDGQSVEPGFSLRETLRLILAAVAGPATGGNGPVTEFKDVNNTKTRISSTVDADGNRGPITYDTSD